MAVRRWGHYSYPA